MTRSLELVNGGAPQIRIGRPTKMAALVGAFVVSNSPLLEANAWADQAIGPVDSSTLTAFMPTGTSPIQGVRPLLIQSGVGMNGSPSDKQLIHIGEPGPAGVGCGVSTGIGIHLAPWYEDIGPNPNGTPTGTGARMPAGNGAVGGRLLSLPQPGSVQASFGLDYNNRQKDNGGTHIDSDSYMGTNFFMTMQMELMFYNGASDADDRVYLILGAESFAEFKRKNGSSNQFVGVNGASGVMDYVAGTSGQPDSYTFTDVVGNQTVFFGFDSNAGVAAGQLWKMIDPAGNTAYVGDATTGTTAISNGYDASGRMLKVYDAAGRRYTLTHTLFLYAGVRLTKIEAETKTGGTWSSPSGLATVGKVEFGYYENDADHYGDAGDLKYIKTTTPMSDSGINQVSYSYLRYWQGSFDASTNPGHPHEIQYVYNSEGLRQMDLAGDSTFDQDFLTASEATLKPYASAYFEYNSDRQVSKAWFNGGCGCSGASAGTYTYTYGTNGSYVDHSGYDTDWATRIVIKTPGTYSGGNVYEWVTKYFDERGQLTAEVVTDGDPAGSPHFWATVITRNSDGQVTEIATPANVTGYTHSTGAFTQSASVGLINVFTRSSSGDTKGMVQHVKYKEGTGGTAYLSKSIFYDAPYKTIGDVNLARPIETGKTIYTVQTSTEDAGPGNSPPSGAYRTELTSTFSSSPHELSVQKIVVTAPVVDTSHNGAGGGTGVQSSRHFRLDGTVDFAKAPDGVIIYREFTNGRVSKVIQDADTTKTSAGQDFDGISIPSGFSSAGSPLHMRTLTTYDATGRTSKNTAYKAKGSSGTVQKDNGLYYTVLADGRTMTLSYAKVVVGSPTQYYGPVQCTVTNLAGKVEFQGVIKLDDNSGEYTTKSQTDHVDETQTDPLLAINWHATNRIGTIARMSTSIYDEVGTQLDESRQYFLIPASGVGSVGTNYDATTYAYDNSGRRWRVESPDGTVRRTVFDAIGRVKEQWIGTNDNDAAFPGGDAGGSFHMVKTKALEYDSGNDKANGRITKRTDFIQDNSTGQRETSYLYDFRGRMIVQINPTAPHTLNKYDDAGRLNATAQYSSSSGLDATDDPTSLDTNRLALSQKFYDEMGRVWKTQQHKIDQADGSDDDSLQELTWYDAVGRITKVDGGQLTKIAYDTVGRRIHTYILASTDDAAYSDADDVSGDIVLQQSDSTYDDNSGLVLTTATIARFHDDLSGGTTGALDTNADGLPLKYTAANVMGRIQIAAKWYDSIDRLVDTVQYGTYGGSDFDRSGLSVPARSDTELRTTTVYNPDGSVKSVIDPRSIETRYLYDDEGRQVAVINNYVNGTPSGTTGDDDVYTRFTYANGHKTEMWVDFDGDGVQDTGDQVTTYNYGVTKGAGAGDSKFSSGSLLHQVIYPAQSGGQSSTDRQNLFAYNAQGQQIWMKDQEGNITEFNYDDSGRQTHKRLTTLGGSFDSAVLRISSTYDSLGRRSLVSQYDNATPGSGSVTDEVKCTYDDWGNLSNFEQDNNSAVGAFGSVDDYEVKYTYSKATGGRNTLRRSSMKYAYGSTDLQTIGYAYRNDHQCLDDDASRVSYVEIGSSPVEIASYDYNGVGSVVGINHNEASIFNRRYAGGGSYPDLDRFNRVTSDTWYKDLSTDLAFFDNDITYDRDSNITLIKDNIFTPSISSGFDAQYSMDNLNRLTKDEQGNWNGSSITSRSRQQIWTLTQSGNWDKNRVDRNGNNSFVDSGDIDEGRTHNDVNEITDRDLDTDGDTAYDDTHYDLSYNKNGEMTDDGENYKYVYDGFGRLRQVKRTSNSALVEEYAYNGLGYRISLKYDTDADNDVDGSDKKFYFAYDERWRVVATYRENDTTPKEQFVYHCAGNDGAGGSSCIDAVILRDKDANTSWTSASDGVLERRDYYCQNWRSDVVAVITSAGKMAEWVKYSAYGIPYGIPVSDTNGDGTVNSADNTNISNWTASPAVKPTGDNDLDGDIDIDDLVKAIFQSGTTMGWGVLSKAGGSGASASRKGYAAYEFDAVATCSIWHVRHRVFNSNLGRWSRRDPMGYIGSPNLASYVNNSPMNSDDPFGLIEAGILVSGEICLNLCNGEVSIGVWGWAGIEKGWFGWGWNLDTSGVIGTIPGWTSMCGECASCNGCAVGGPVFSLPPINLGGIECSAMFDLHPPCSANVNLICTWNLLQYYPPLTVILPVLETITGITVELGVQGNIDITLCKGVSGNWVVDGNQGANVCFGVYLSIGWISPRDRDGIMHHSHSIVSSM